MVENATESKATAADIRAQWLEDEKRLRARAKPPASVVLQTAMQYSGLEFLRAIMNGELPAVPMGETLDYFMVVVEPGYVVFQGNPRPAFFNPLGSVNGGWMASLLDACTAGAFQSMVPTGKGFTTLEFKVNLTRVVMPEVGPLRAEGKIIAMGSRVGSAEGRLVDAAGRIYAHAVSTCLVIDLGDLTQKPSRK